MNVGNSSVQVSEAWAGGEIATPLSAYEQVIASGPTPPLTPTGATFSFEALRFDVGATSSSSIERTIALSFEAFATYNDLNQQLGRLRSLEADWDSYGADAPAESAIQRTRDCMAQFLAAGLYPDKLVPSAEGGVGMVFSRGDKYADIEFFNDGESVAVQYQGSQEPTAWNVVDDREAMVRLAAFFRSSAGG